MIEYVGDVSKFDAEVLKELALKSKSILEAGVGASTQILRHYSPEGAFMLSVESEKSWIDRTVENLKNLNIAIPVVFELYDGFKTDRIFDLIFDDCVDGYRLDFAINHWKNLQIGGILALHDTRRSSDIKNVCAIIERFSPEIESVYINVNHSNITIIKKKEAEFYENWNITENRTAEQSGYN